MPFGPGDGQATTSRRGLAGIGTPLPSLLHLWFVWNWGRSGRWVGARAKTVHDPGCNATLSDRRRDAAGALSLGVVSGSLTPG
jgi:hypothetical protein